MLHRATVMLIAAAIVAVVLMRQAPAPPALQHAGLVLPSAETPAGPPVPASPRVVLIEPVRPAPSSAAMRQARVCSRRAAEFMDLCGIPFGRLNDSTFSSADLKPYGVALLPFNTLGDAQVRSLAAYVQGGGRLLAFYPQAPAALFALLGVQNAGSREPAYANEFRRIGFEQPAQSAGFPEEVEQDSWCALGLTPAEGTQVLGWWEGAGKRSGAAVTLNGAGMLVGHVLTVDDPQGKRGFLLAALAQLDPAVWGQAARSRRAAGLQRLKRLESRWSAVKRRPAMAAHAQQVAGLAAKARQALEGVPPFPPSDAWHGRAAYDAAGKGAHLLDCIEGAMMPAPAGELRGVWIHTYDPTNWDTVMAKLKAGGINAVFVRVGRGGNVIYPNSLLPEDAWAQQAGGDELQRAIDAAHKYGLAFHAWRVLYHLGSAPDAYKQQMAAEDRLVRDSSGAQSYWANPGDPRNQDLEYQVMMDLVSRYDIDGLHLDYVRYPDEPSFRFDYGPVSRREFEHAAGVRVRRWPADVISGSLHARYEEWQRSNISQLVQRVSKGVRAAKPKVKLSAAVWRNYPGCRTSVRQEWPSWVRAGWLDFVVPMNYVRDTAAQEQAVRGQIRYIAGKRPLMAGIGSWQLQSVSDVLAQVRATRDAGARGFVLFSYSDDRIGDILDAIGAGVSGRD